MLERFGAEIWTAGGPSISIAGFVFPTRLIVIRLQGGGLFVWSPTALTEGLRAEIDRLGSVRHIVAPSALHHKFVGEWQTAYPNARCYAAPGLREKRPDLTWDEDLIDKPPAAWTQEIDQVIVRGNKITTEVVFFHRPSQTAIFTDLIQNFEEGWFKGWRSIAARLDLMTASRPTVLRKYRATFYDRRAARSAIERILDWPTEALLAAHCKPMTADGRAAIAHAFNWLLR